MFVVIEHGSQRLARVHVTTHLSADWTLQQLREVIGYDYTYRYLIHEGIASSRGKIRALDLSVLKSPPRCKANSICERVIGTIRRVPRLADPNV
jgi:hypothetical protein